MKILTEEQSGFKGAEYYKNLKTRFNQNDVNNAYNRKYKLPEYIGYCMRNFERFKPTSYEDAFNKYIESGYDTGHDALNKGRTKDELEAIAMEWMAECPNSKLELADFYDAMVLHAVIETYDGYMREKQVKDALNSVGAKIDNVSGNEDVKMAIDVKAELNGNVFLIQVKPVSFFAGSHNEALNNDRAALIKKEMRARNKYGVNTFFRYLIYDSWGNGEWLINMDKNKCSFSYDELLDENGKPKVDVDKLRKNKTTILFNNNR